MDLELTGRLKAEARPARVRPGRHRPGRGASRLPALPRLARRRPRGGHGLPRAPGGGPGPSRPPARRGPVGVVVSFVYGRPDADRRPTATQGKVARYARGADYHELLWRRLEALLDWLRGRVPRAPRPGRGRHRPAARTRLRPAGRARLDRQEHDADRPPPGQLHRPGRAARRPRAGARRAAPTPATAAPAPAASTPARPTPSPAPTSSTPAAASATGRSSTRGPIADAFADQLDDWVFGCDVCQDVCPWNRKAPPGASRSWSRGPSGPTPT